MRLELKHSKTHTDTIWHGEFAVVNISIESSSLIYLQPYQGNRVHTLEKLFLELNPIFELSNNIPDIATLIMSLVLL